MSNTNGLTFAAFKAALQEAGRSGIAAQRAKRAELLAGFGEKVDVNPYDGRYTISPMGWKFACGKETFADEGFSPYKG